ncbi:hypothetical protein B5807_02447 [Epicoccum nigrum]|uniref:Uncharacterized protein n=1 Tax=Epicoccum nigrum TaxID=105696 RepID=A0A1Y2MAY4_EPING|nr:hypothetical protein B5807_02447 [Epicoccum nigrum]
MAQCRALKRPLHALDAAAQQLDSCPPAPSLFRHAPANQTTQHFTTSATTQHITTRHAWEDTSVDHLLISIGSSVHVHQVYLKTDAPLTAILVLSTPLKYIVTYR